MALQTIQLSIDTMYQICYNYLNLRKSTDMKMDNLTKKSLTGDSDMPIMIPDSISDDVSMSEKMMFETFKLIPKARDWVIFHGVKIPSHDNSANSSKIDFIILIPSFVSVICLKIVGESYNTKDRKSHN